MNIQSDQPRIASVQCLSPEGLHRVTYKDWGAPDNPRVLVCVHGLTRISDDFDTLAAALAGQYRVVCPDVVGRGRSAWFNSPPNYQIPQYVADMVTLIASLKVPEVAFLGTSMGGLIGMILASLPNSPISKLIINDVGPTLNAEALARISKYVSEPQRFDTFEGGAAYIRSISRTFGDHTEQEWHKFCNDVLRQDSDGKWIRHYDLRLGIPMQNVNPELAAASQAMLWRAYDAITCPTLLLRGAQSDLLLPETAQEMTRRGPKARLVEFAEVGHAPTLVHDDQIAPIKEFLLGAKQTHASTASSIQRFHVGARLSDMAVQRGTIYLAGQVTSDDSLDMAGQTRDVLAQIDRLLAEAGSDKTRILMCQIYLADLNDFAVLNQIWDQWVVPGATPPRATVQAALANPVWRIEIVVTAAVEEAS